MKIVAYNKCTFVDYPGKIASILFTQGCNMTCRYCHNLSLNSEVNKIEQKEIIEHLDKRKKVLDGIVISGGEPTIHPKLIDFLEELQHLNISVKLDTNGTNPEMLKKIIKLNLVDYIAMDIKANSTKYKQICGKSYEEVEESIRMIRQFQKYEFRMTTTPELSIEDIQTVCHEFEEDRFYLQQYRKTPYCDLEPHANKVLKSMSSRYKVHLRNIDDVLI